MRGRLMLAMVGLVAVVLVIAGVGSLLLTRREARQQAQQQLVSEAQSLTKSRLGARSPAVLRVVRATLKLEEQGEFAVGYYHQRQDFFKKQQEAGEDGDSKADEGGES